jgi:nitrite reductase/ring-hydroxylating ferredoxin subunit
MSEPSPTRVAVYRRTVSAPLERVWENVYDWEHLPWLHHTSFRGIRLLDSGRWGWRARIAPQPADSPEILVELVREEARERYVARTVEGPGAGTEIWTTLLPEGERTGVEVEFHVPGVAPGDADAVGAAFVALYTRLWDEDEGMMVERSARLAELARPAAATAGPLDLGTSAELRARLPLIVQFGARRFRIVADGDDLAVHACVCPHRLGPLDSAEVSRGRVRCPWHGYEFDLGTGRSSDGRGLRLAPPPRLQLEAASGRWRLVE